MLYSPCCYYFNIIAIPVASLVNIYSMSDNNNNNGNIKVEEERKRVCVSERSPLPTKHLQKFNIPRNVVTLSRLLGRSCLIFQNTLVLNFILCDDERKKAATYSLGWFIFSNIRLLFFTFLFLPFFSCVTVACYIFCRIIYFRNGRWLLCICTHIKIHMFYFSFLQIFLLLSEQCKLLNFIPNYLPMPLPGFLK